MNRKFLSPINKLFISFLIICFTCEVPPSYALRVETTLEASGLEELKQKMNPDFIPHSAAGLEKSEDKPDEEELLDSVAQRGTWNDKLRDGKEVNVAVVAEVFKGKPGFLELVSALYGFQGGDVYLVDDGLLQDQAAFPGEMGLYIGREAFSQTPLSDLISAFGSGDFSQIKVSRQRSSPDSGTSDSPSVKRIKVSGKTDPGPGRKVFRKPAKPKDKPKVDPTASGPPVSDTEVRPVDSIAEDIRFHGKKFLGGTLPPNSTSISYDMESRQERGQPFLLDSLRGGGETTATIKVVVGDVTISIDTTDSPPGFQTVVLPGDPPTVVIVPYPATLPNTAFRNVRRYRATVRVEDINNRVKKNNPTLKEPVIPGSGTSFWDVINQKNNPWDRPSHNAVYWLNHLRTLLEHRSPKEKLDRHRQASEYGTEVEDIVGALRELVRREQVYRRDIVRAQIALNRAVERGVIPAQVLKDNLEPLLEDAVPWPRLHVGLADYLDSHGEAPVERDAVFQDIEHLLQAPWQETQWLLSARFRPEVLAEVYYDAFRYVWLEEIIELQRELESSPASSRREDLMGEIIYFARRITHLEREASSTELVTENARLAEERESDGSTWNMPVGGGGVLLLNAEGVPEEFIPGEVVIPPQAASVRFPVARVRERYRPGNQIVLFYSSFVGGPNYEQVGTFLDDAFILQKLLPGSPEAKLGTVARDGTIRVYRLRIPWREAYRVFLKKLPAWQEFLVLINKTVIQKQIKTEVARRMAQDFPALLYVLLVDSHLYSKEESGRVVAFVGMHLGGEVSRLEKVRLPKELRWALPAMIYRATMVVGERLASSFLESLFELTAVEGFPEAPPPDFSDPIFPDEDPEISGGKSGTAGTEPAPPTDEEIRVLTTALLPGIIAKHQELDSEQVHMFAQSAEWNSIARKTLPQFKKLRPVDFLAGFQKWQAARERERSAADQAEERSREATEEILTRLREVSADSLEQLSQVLTETAARPADVNDADWAHVQAARQNAAANSAAAAIAEEVRAELTRIEELNNGTPLLAQVVRALSESKELAARAVDAGQTKWAEQLQGARERLVRRAVTDVSSQIRIAATNLDSPLTQLQELYEHAQTIGGFVREITHLRNIFGESFNQSIDIFGIALEAKRFVAGIILEVDSLTLEMTDLITTPEITPEQLRNRSDEISSRAELIRIRAIRGLEVLDRNNLKNVIPELEDAWRKWRAQVQELNAKLDEIDMKEAAAQKRERQTHKEQHRPYEEKLRKEAAERRRKEEIRKREEKKKKGHTAGLEEGGIQIIESSERAISQSL